jgi:hypothetical protein
MAILSQGNNDGSYYSNPTGVVAYVTDPETWLQVGFADPLYDVFIINAADFQTASSPLADFLERNNNGKVHFVVSHYPFHSARPGIPEGADGIFSVLYDYGAIRDIVFLWGHNHSENYYYDAGVDYVALPGEMIGGVGGRVNGNAWVPLTFTCLNAGYAGVGTPDYYGPGTLGSMTTAVVNPSTDAEYPNTIQIQRQVNRRDPWGSVYGPVVTIDRLGELEVCDAEYGENACNNWAVCSAHVAGTCANACGGFGSGCWCDDLCNSYGDCCQDKLDLCGC